MRVRAQEGCAEVIPRATCRSDPPVWHGNRGMVGRDDPVPRQESVGGQVVGLSAPLRTQSRLDHHSPAPPAPSSSLPLRRSPPAHPRERGLAPAARRVQTNRASAWRIANFSPSGSGRPPSWSPVPDVICQTRTLTARGANATPRACGQLTLSVTGFARGWPIVPSPRALPGSRMHGLPPHHPGGGTARKKPCRFSPMRRRGRSTFCPSM